MLLAQNIARSNTYLTERFVGDTDWILTFLLLGKDLVGMRRPDIMHAMTDDRQYGTVIVPYPD